MWSNIQIILFIGWKIWIGWYRDTKDISPRSICHWSRRSRRNWCWTSTTGHQRFDDNHSCHPSCWTAFFPSRTPITRIRYSKIPGRGGGRNNACESSNCVPSTGRVESFTWSDGPFNYGKLCVKYKRSNAGCLFEQLATGGDCTSCIGG